MGKKHRAIGISHPYGGFLPIRRCAKVTLRACVYTGRKTYTTIGSAGKPGSLGF